MYKAVLFSLCAILPAVFAYRGKCTGFIFQARIAGAALATIFMLVATCYNGRTDDSGTEQEITKDFKLIHCTRLGLQFIE
jgi:hypothetical protein